MLQGCERLYKSLYTHRLKVLPRFLRSYYKNDSDDINIDLNDLNKSCDNLNKCSDDYKEYFNTFKDDFNNFNKDNSIKYKTLRYDKVVNILNSINLDYIDSSSKNALDMLFSELYSMYDQNMIIVCITKPTDHSISMSMRKRLLSWIILNKRTEYLIFIEELGTYIHNKNPVLYVEECVDGILCKFTTHSEKSGFIFYNRSFYYLENVKKFNKHTIDKDIPCDIKSYKYKLSLYTPSQLKDMLSLS